MYYEEKIINGILHWRGHPEGEFKPYSIEALSQMVVELQKKEREAYMKGYHDHQKSIRELIGI
jgi:hypothetical protein